MKVNYKALRKRVGGKKLLILAVLLLGMSLWRGYHLADYALFRADQARDAYYIKEAVEQGPGHLRLLGPKAGAAVINDGHRGAFHLGPIYNYCQYLSALILGRIDGLVLLLPDFLLGVLAVVLFYYFLGYFFEYKVVLLVTILFAFSYIGTLYGRFAWNINQVVFWELLFVLGLLKMANRQGTKGKNENSRCESSIGDGIGRWFVITVVSLAIIGQLHLLSAIVFLGLFLTWWFIYRFHVAIKYILFATLLAFILYAPMIVSDIYNQGDNVQRFFLASKVEKKEKGSVGKKWHKLNDLQGRNFILLLSAYNKYDYKKIDFLGEWFVWSSVGIVLLLLCLKGCNLQLLKKRLPDSVVFKVEQIQKQLILTKQQKSFLLLVILWFVAFLLIYYQILPRLHKIRYWLLVEPLPFVFLALWFWFIERIVRYQIITYILIVGVFLFLLLSNLSATGLFYQSLSNGHLVSNKWHKKITVGPYNFLSSYGEMKEVVDYMVKNAQGGPICFKSMEYQHKLGFSYLFDLYWPNVRYLQTGDGYKYDCNFYLITKATRGEREVFKYLKSVQFDDYENVNKIQKTLSHKKFRSLIVWDLTDVFFDGERNGDKREIIENKSSNNGEIQAVVFWRQIFGLP